MSSIRRKFAELSRTSSDAAGAQALLAWLDTLPPSVLVAAEGRRRAGIGGRVSDTLPEYRPATSRHLIVEVEVEMHSEMAKLAWEHPGMLWSEK